MTKEWKNQLKRILRSVIPTQTDSFLSYRQNLHGQKVMAESGIPTITTQVVERYGYKILEGPFEGIEYISESAGSSLIPKLIGCYESELHNIMNAVTAATYDVIVDIGSAEGYYAIGLAVRVPTAAIYAFDINRSAQLLCRKLAALNKVEDRVIISGKCDTVILQSVLKGRSLVLCDCEGYEGDILNPMNVPALIQSDILVELHDFIRPGVTNSLQNRFNSTHEILMIDSTDRNPTDYPKLGFLPPNQQSIAVSEFRNARQQWAYMTPKVPMV